MNLFLYFMLCVICVCYVSLLGILVGTAVLQVGRIQAVGLSLKLRVSESLSESLFASLLFFLKRQRERTRRRRAKAGHERVGCIFLIERLDAHCHIFGRFARSLVRPRDCPESARPHIPREHCYCSQTLSHRPHTSFVLQPCVSIQIPPNPAITQMPQVITDGFRAPENAPARPRYPPRPRGLSFEVPESRLNAD